MSKIQEQIGDTPTCPYCEHKYDLDYTMDDNEEMEIECGVCSKKYRTNSSHTVTYFSLGDCKLNNELPHRLRLEIDFENIKVYKCLKCGTDFPDWALPSGEFPKLVEGEFEFLGKQ